MLPDKNAPLHLYSVGVYKIQMLASIGSSERKSVQTFVFCDPAWKGPETTCHEEAANRPVSTGSASGGWPPVPRPGWNLYKQNGLIVFPHPQSCALGRGGVGQGGRKEQLFDSVER